MRLYIGFDPVFCQGTAKAPLISVARGSMLYFARFIFNELKNPSYLCFVVISYQVNMLKAARQRILLMSKIRLLLLD